jgi:hypothetical protein
MSFYFVVLTYPLPDPFPVNIFQDNSISENEMIPKAELTFGHLKQIIVRVMEKSPTVYKNICEVKSLWKVEGLAEGGNKWTILEEIANDKDETSIEQKLRALGNKLKSSVSVDHELSFRRGKSTSSCNRQRPPPLVSVSQWFTSRTRNSRYLTSYIFLFDQRREDTKSRMKKMETPKRKNYSKKVFLLILTY